MSLGWFVLELYLAGLLFAGGVLWERERLLNEPPTGWAEWLRWWWSYLVSVLGWPIVAVFWWGSRPVPRRSPPERGQVQRQEVNGEPYLFTGARWVGRQEVQDMSSDNLRAVVLGLLGERRGRMTDEPPF